MIPYIAMASLYLIHNVPAPLEKADGDLTALVAKASRIPADRIKTAKVVKRSIDARKKPRLRWVLQIEFETITHRVVC